MRVKIATNRSMAWKDRETFDRAYRTCMGAKEYKVIWGCPRQAWLVGLIWLILFIWLVYSNR
jgi:hypothetical protein